MLHEPSVINHQTTVLNDFDSGLSECFRDRVMTDSQLHPDRLWFFPEDVVNVRWNVLRTTKDIYHVDLARHINQFSVNFFTENFGDVGVVNRDRNDFESGAMHVVGNVESRLISLGLGLDAEHGDRFRLREQLANLLSASEDIVAPVHDEPQITQIDTDSKTRGVRSPRVSKGNYHDKIVEWRASCPP